MAPFEKFLSGIQDDVMDVSPDKVVRPKPGQIPFNEAGQGNLPAQMNGNNSADLNSLMKMAGLDPSEIDMEYSEKQTRESGGTFILEKHLKLRKTIK
jgi:hypothetical protein